MISQYWGAYSVLSPDIQQAARRVLRDLKTNAGFSIVLVTVLAIGTGSLSLIFALLNHVVLRPLPFDEPDQLVLIRHSARGLGLTDAGVSDGLYKHYKERAHSFASIAAYQGRVVLSVRLPDQTLERVHVTYASASLFEVLRISPAFGRSFAREDVRSRSAEARQLVPILLSHSFWISRLGGDPSVVGRPLIVNDSPREIVGILPEGFAFPRADVQIWMLFEPSQTTGNLVRHFDWDSVARLRPGITVGFAHAELADLVGQLEARSLEVAAAQLSPAVRPLKAVVLGDVANLIWLVFGAMTLLLIVSCANAGALFLIRAEQRDHEMFVRYVLGARIADLWALFFIAALIPATTAAAVGLVLTNGSLRLLRALVALEVPRLGEVAVDSSAVLFAVVLAILIAILYAFLAVGPLRRSLFTMGPLRARTFVPPRSRHRTDALIVLQTACALTLMVASVLMVKTYRNLSDGDLGFSPDGILTVECVLPYRKAARHVAIYHNVIDRLRRLPDVVTASAASFIPLRASADLFPTDAGPKPVLFKFVLPGYFQTMGTRVLEGEQLVDGEHMARPGSILVSASLARRLYPTRNAIGHTLRRLNDDRSIVKMFGRPMPPFAIASVVADVRETTLRGGPTEIIYVPVIEPPVEQAIVPTTMHLILKTRVPPISLAATARRAITEIEPDLAIGQIHTMNSVVDDARSREAFVGVLLLIAATVSLFLGATSIYGSVAQAVRGRRRDIGVRAALGASSKDLVLMVAMRSLRAMVCGGLLGVIVSLLLTRYLESLLFGVKPHDATVLLSTAAILIVSSVVAAILGARHATRVAPIAALRTE